MHSQQSFTPGKNSTSYKLINYITEYNAMFPNAKQLTCAKCSGDIYNKFVIGSDSPSRKVSNNIRTSQIVNYSKGGKTQYGNFYLGQPLNINYLGRMEGMSGGSGSAPKNQFN
jgi:hypothetical protein